MSLCCVSINCVKTCTSLYVKNNSFFPYNDLLSFAISLCLLIYSFLLSLLSFLNNSTRKKNTNTSTAQAFLATVGVSPLWFNDLTSSQCAACGFNRENNSGWWPMLTCRALMQCHGHQRAVWCVCVCGGGGVLPVQGPLTHPHCPGIKGLSRTYWQGPPLIRGVPPGRSGF